MKDRTITVEWCGESQTFDIRAHQEEGEINSSSLLLSMTLGELEQFMVELNKAHMNRIMELKKESDKHD